MKIAILGTGAVGGYFGGKLAQAGFDVTFLARGTNLEVIRKNGLYIKSINGDFTVQPVKATDKITEVAMADWIIVCVKAWQVKEIARNISRIISKGATILPLQNGVLAMDELAEEIAEQHVIGGICRIFSKAEAPGIINHFGAEPAILFGEKNNSKSPRMYELLEILEKAGIKAGIAGNIQVEIWKKFINICTSGLLAVTRCTYGELRELKETRRMMISLIHEIYELSQKMGIPVEPEFVDKTIAFIDTYPYDSTSSLTRDVWEGKPSEIEYQNGTVVRLGEKYEVDTPVNRFVYECILPMELKARNIQFKKIG